MALFGSLGKWVGKGLKGVSKAAGVIPGLGTLAGAGLGGLGELFEKGSKINLKGFAKSAGGGALSGALGGLLGLGGKGGGGIGGFLKNALTGGGGGGGGIGGFLKSAASGALGGEGGGLGGTLGKLLMGGLGAAETYGNYKQSKKDSKYSRMLAEEAVSNYRQARQMAQDNWAAKSPLRDAFNFGAFNMSDPTNPFSRDIFAGMGPRAPGDESVPEGQVIDTINNLRNTGGQAPNGLMSMIQSGGRTPGDPTMRSASVKSGRNAQAQDRGRDRMRDDNDEQRYM